MDVVKEAHFIACKVKRSRKQTPALQGSPPPASLTGTTLVPSCFSLKSQLRSACSYLVTTHFSLTLCKCFYFHVSCWIQNDRLLLRDVHRTLLFQQKTKETCTFVPLYSDPLTKERKLRPDTSNFKTHTHKGTSLPPPPFWETPQPYYCRLILVDNDLQVHTLIKNALQYVQEECYTNIFMTMLSYIPSKGELPEIPTEPLRNLQ